MKGLALFLFFFFPIIVDLSVYVMLLTCVPQNEAWEVLIAIILYNFRIHFEELIWGNFDFLIEMRVVLIVCLSFALIELIVCNKCVEIL